MKTGKRVIAALMAALMLATTANATVYKADLVVSGKVIGLGSIATGPLPLGEHTKIYFNDPTTKYDLFVTVNVSEGVAYQLCPDTPAVAWPLNSGAAINISASGNEFWLMAFRDDGVTPLTPTSCWDRVGTGADEQVKITWKTYIPDGKTGKGDLAKTLSVSLVLL